MGLHRRANWCWCRGHLRRLLRVLLALPRSASHINDPDEARWTPLIIAASCGKADAVLVLLQAGASAESRTESGQIALHYHKACLWRSLHSPVWSYTLDADHGQGHVAIIEALLPATRDLNAKDGQGATPLHRAAGPGFVPAVQAACSPCWRTTQEGLGCLHRRRFTVVS